MSKDLRLTIRLNDDIDQWLGEQAELKGLDKAAFARMVLFERKNATLPLATHVERRSAPAPIARDVLAVSSESRDAEQGVVDADPEEPVYDPPAYDPPAEPIDVDALVDAQIEQAAAAGLTARREDPDPPPQSVGGVRALHRAPIPFSTQTVPGHLRS